MNRTFSICSMLIALPLLAVSLPAAAESGEQLYEAHCKSCHDSSVFTRENRRVKDLAALHEQVRRCQQGNGLKWSDKDIDAVATYLDKSFYKF